MNDIFFDITTMDVKVSADGDFVNNSNSSEQNGAVMLISKNCNIYYPLAGVGFQNQDLKTIDLENQMADWENQVKQDGAKSANWNLTQEIQKDGTIKSKLNTTCNYE